MRSLRGYLGGMTALLVLLVCGATAGLLWQLENFNRAQTQQQLLETSRAMSLAVDGQLQGYEGMLRALRESDALSRGDWPVFDAKARRLLSGPDAWIVLSDREGRQLVNTRVPLGASLPKGPAAPRMWPELDAGRSRICDLATGRIERRILCVDVPVVRQGRTVYALSVIFRPQLLKRTVERQRSRGRYLTVLDSRGVVIWSNVAPETYIGRPATPSLLAAMRRAPEGVQRSVSLDGVPTEVAFSRSPVSGWTFVLAAPRSTLAAGRLKAAREGLWMAALLMALAAGGGLLVGRRLTSGLKGLSAAAHRIRSGEPTGYRPSRIAEIDEVAATLDAAIAERNAAQERFDLAQEVGGIGSWDWDVLKDEGHVSHAYKQMHGLVAVDGALKLAQVLAVIHPEDLAGYQARLAAATRSAEPSTNEYRVVRPDGSIRWVSAKGRPIFDDNGRMTGAVGVVIDLTERKAAEDQLRLLMHEVDHPANNLMAVVQAIVNLSQGDGPALREVVTGRVEALARAHQLLAESRWQGADLKRLADEELLPFGLGDRGRVEAHGPSVALAPAAAQGVAMALHELATNAAKHGALSRPEGVVRLSWRQDDGWLRLRWEEAGGPPVAPPASRGFGTTVLQRALGGPVGGRVRLDWRAEGLACDLELPLMAGSPDLQPASLSGEAAA